MIDRLLQELVVEERLGATIDKYISTRVLTKVHGIPDTNRGGSSCLRDIEIGKDSDLPLVCNIDQSERSESKTVAP